MEAYPNRAVFIGDLYILKAGVACDINDVMAFTGSTVNGRAEVDKMSGSYSPNVVAGMSCNKISAIYPHREIALAVHGPLITKVAETIAANDKLMGSSNTITELFNGAGTAQQKVYVGNVPINTVTTFKELTGPTTLTRVYVTPTTNQYYLNDTTGELTIGGTSVSSTNNYQLIYTIDSGRLAKLIEYVEESLTVTTHVATLSHIPDDVEYVEAVTGTKTGGCKILTGAPVVTLDVQLTRASKTLTFLAADAVTACKVRYRTQYKKCARALEGKSAGELLRMFFFGVGGD